jgi:hypothetical protein
MLPKQLLLPDRRRTLPRSGFSWVDRRFLREFAPGLSREAILLYFFLTAVSDKNGLSYYQVSTLAGRLRLPESDIVRARNELLDRDLLAFRHPLVQVLALPAPRTERGDAQSLGDLFSALAHRAQERNQP